jgi:hypothetical protein
VYTFTVCLVSDVINFLFSSALKAFALTFGSCSRMMLLSTAFRTHVILAIATVSHCGMGLG